MKTVLWLDDWRDPHTNPEWVRMFSPIPFPDKVFWVKSYHDFMDFIEYIGVPDVICFDHDLGDDNGEPIPTGYDCAAMLVEHLRTYNLPLPLYGIQSANPVGKERIINVLEDYRNEFNSSKNSN